MGRRLALVAAAGVVALVCLRLGFWQLDRLDQRRDLNEQIRSMSSVPAAPLGEVVAEDAEARWYRKVTATGTFEPDAELILYGRPLDGRPGDHVLTLLRLTDGSAVLVDRGWIPFDAETTAPVGGPAAAPTTEVTVTGTLLPSEEDAAFGDGSDRLRSVNVEEIAAHLGEELVPDYVLLADQSPAQPEGLPVPPDPPELSEGPHLSYAIQWFSFAVIAIVGCVVLLRHGGRGRGDQPDGDHDTEVPSETA